MRKQLRPKNPPPPSRQPQTLLPLPPSYIPLLLSDSFTTVCRVGDLAEGQGRTVVVDNHLVAIFLVNGEYRAIDDLCPHQGASLSEGMLEGNSIVCPWHAWVFDVTTGQSPVNPRAKIPCVPVKVEGNDVFVNL